MVTYPAVKPPPPDLMRGPMRCSASRTRAAEQGQVEVLSEVRTNEPSPPDIMPRAEWGLRRFWTRPIQSPKASLVAARVGHQ
jgi:hypothetical protein